MSLKLQTRVPHILKGVRSIQHPTNFCFFDTETINDPKRKEPKCTFQVLCFGVAIAYRTDSGRVTHRKELVFTSTEEFFDFIETRVHPKKPLYVFSHNLGFDGTIIDLWNEVVKREYICTYVILADPPNMLEFKTPRGTITFVDTFNYFKASVKKIGESFGLAKLKQPKKIAYTKQCIQYCRIDVEIIAKAVMDTIQFLSQYDLGSFGPTIASIAMNVYRHKFMKHDIYIHDDYKLLAIERQSYYGGIVRNFYIGTIRNQKVYKLDVNSLYPSVMTKDYPTKLLYRLNNPSLEVAKKAIRTKGTVGYVYLQSPYRTFPCKVNGKLCEATGEYNTTLAGPELLAALSCSAILKVGYLAVYDTAPIFSDYIDYFWKRRHEFKEQRNGIWEQTCKLLMNSLYGKFGQHSSNWLPLTPENLIEVYRRVEVPFPSAYRDEISIENYHLGEFKWFPANLGFPLTCRSIGGKVDFNIPYGEHHISSPIIASYVTSYARERIRELIAIAGEKNCYYTDTDSIFTNSVGYSNLMRAGEVNPRELGKLKVEGVSTSATFYCPKDYIFKRKRVAKGIRSNAKRINKNTWVQDQFERLRSVIKRGYEPYVRIKRIRKTNKRVYDKGTISKSGRVQPLVLSERMVIHNVATGKVRVTGPHD